MGRSWLGRPLRVCRAGQRCGGEGGRKNCDGRDQTMTFRQAVERTPNLEQAWRAGLQALRPEDRPHISPEEPQNLRGSADIDTALLKTEPQANRWDFAIAYQHTNLHNEFIYWVETHTGSDSQVSVVLKKFEWLKSWLRLNGGH